MPAKKWPRKSESLKPISNSHKEPRLLLKRSSLELMNAGSGCRSTEKKSLNSERSSERQHLRRPKLSVSVERSSRNRALIQRLGPMPVTLMDYASSKSIDSSTTFNYNIAFQEFKRKPFRVDLPILTTSTEMAMMTWLACPRMTLTTITVGSMTLTMTRHTMVTAMMIITAHSTTISLTITIEIMTTMVMVIMALVMVDTCMQMISRLKSMRKSRERISKLRNKPNNHNSIKTLERSSPRRKSKSWRNCLKPQRDPRNLIELTGQRNLMHQRDL